MKIFTPHEKAIDLIHKISKIDTDSPVQLSIIFVNEMINQNENNRYWEKVKLELKSLL